MKKLSLLFLALICLFSNLASARIFILIDEASGKKFPIAVPRFLNEKGRPVGGLSKKMEEVMKKDLIVAGLFKVLGDDILPQEDHDVDTINFEKWKAVEIGALVKGIQKKVGGEQVLQLRLYDVADGSMLLGKQYTVNGKNYVDAVHRYMDALMESLTGFRGPFESRIAASCGKPWKRQITTYEMDGERITGGVKRGQNNISPSISPDGGRIAYTSFTSRFPEVWVDGRQVTHFQSTTITPVWTPDGGSLIVASAKSGDTELYQISLSGRILRQITHSRNIDLSASLSPDGRIVFASERAGDLHLFSSSLSGEGASRLTFVGYQNDQPDWSPDGSKIVFASRDQGAFDIFVMDAGGSNIMRLTRGEGSNESPTWSPDSRYIAFASTRGGVYVMLEDGTNQTLIPKSGGCINLDWGPWLSEK